jgi:hypothetical protein
VSVCVCVRCLRRASMNLGLGKLEEACTQMGAKNPNCLCGLTKSIALLGGWSCPFIDPRA